MHKHHSSFTSDIRTHFDVRTDLAVEETERHRQTGKPSLSGVSVQEYFQCDGQVHVTQVSVENEDGAQALGKSQGHYITLDVASMKQNDGESHRDISCVLASHLKDLIKPHTNKDQPIHVLAVGLGNANITPDALGPQVLSHLLITRHLKNDLFQHPAFSVDSASVCGIVPGVMAQTGMETAEIVKAITNQIQPDLIFVIDALAARSVTRLGTTIQVTDTGIHPGSGVGNHRHGLTKDSLGIPVIAIGVPTVVGAAAIVTDTLDTLMDVLCRETDSTHLAKVLHDMGPDEKYTLVHQLLTPHFGPMFVTPKDIDETIQRISFIISEGINIALFGQVIKDR